MQEKHIQHQDLHIRRGEKRLGWWWGKNKPKRLSKDAMKDERTVKDLFRWEEIFKSCL